jgi:EAL domain-containing protein (putative c-di-GMP-specific phosphodiesterase class I)
MDAIENSASALARVVVARRGQLAFRVGVAVAVAGVCQALTGWQVALVWVALYTAVQVGENQAFRNVSSAADLTPRRIMAILAAISAGTAVFGALGILQAVYSGPWGFACASLVWSGAIINGAMVNSGSRPALFASIMPTALYFLSAPFFAFIAGASVAHGFIIIFAGVLNIAAVVKIWSMSQTLIDTERRERLMTHLTLHDPESGLPNRRALEQDIAGMPASGADSIVVAVLGIDRFAQVRGAIGHELFAALVGEVAGRLAGVHPDGRIVRLSTAELGLVFRAANSQQACARAAAFQASLNAPLRLGENKIDVSLTVGLAIDGMGQELVASLVERANIALDQARSLKSRIGMFDATVYGNPANNLSLMSEMLLAIEAGELAVAYQPKFDFRTRAVTGVEALARWPNRRGGPLGPDIFVPMAEETGHIQALTEWVLVQALADQAALRRAGFDISMSVNLSGRLLHDRDFSEKVTAIVGAGADRFCLEVTETAAMESPELAMRSLNQYRAAGINVAIDDYGSGLSSLAYLKNFPATELKIDKAFVLDIENSQRDSLLVRSTIDLGHSLGMLVTAEGVETATALSLLALMGCDAAQGYFIGRPMPLDELIAFLRRDPETAVQIAPASSLATAGSLRGIPA